MMKNKINYKKVRDYIRTDFKISPENAERKEEGDNRQIREFLQVQWMSPENRPERIIGIGINPSVATTGKSDMTMTKLCRFLDMYGFNNVSMLNLYESVTPKQQHISKSTATNFETKRYILEKADMILLVWGVDGNENRKNEASVVLKDYADKIYCIKNQRGSFPVHPSRMAYDSELIAVDLMEDYIKCGIRL